MVDGSGPWGLDPHLSDDYTAGSNFKWCSISPSISAATWSNGSIAQGQLDHLNFGQRRTPG